MQQYAECYIAGSWTATEGDGFHPLIDPATEEQYGQIRVADHRDVDRAVNSARQALYDGPWGDTSLAERIEFVSDMREWLAHNAEMTIEDTIRSLGMPPYFARMMPTVSVIDMYVEAIKLLPLEFLRRDFSGTTLVSRRPVGVVAGITPWNTPLRAEIKKAIPALLAGCTVVLKPAPDTPFGGLALAKAAEAVGLPAGVLNVVFGGGETGEALVGHAGVEKVAFTGSTATGARIGRICGETFKRVQLELGGKSAAIVLDDADLDRTVPLLDMANFAFTGQGCTDLTRILVPRSRVDELSQSLVERARAYRVGDPHDAETTMGPLVNRAQFEKVLRYIDIGKREGAHLLTGGGRPPGLPKGWYIEPTVFSGVTNSMRIAREEIFGPVACIIAYEGDDEAIAIANDSDFGLNGAVFSADEGRALGVARKVRSGTVAVNKYVGAISAPFGGIKQSGIGREHGPEGIEAFLEYRCHGVTEPLAQALSDAGTPVEVFPL